MTNETKIYNLCDSFVYRYSATHQTIIAYNSQAEYLENRKHLTNAAVNRVLKTSSDLYDLGYSTQKLLKAIAETI